MAEPLIPKDVAFSPPEDDMLVAETVPGTLKVGFAQVSPLKASRVFVAAPQKTRRFAV